MISLYTIGVSRKKAASFFHLLESAGIKRVIDIRLKNTSALLGFSKRDDLAFFLDSLLGCEYIHEPLFAPTDALLNAYRKGEITWGEYEELFIPLMRERRIENGISLASYDRSCFLCSEPTPDRCHRRLVVEYIQSECGRIEIVHL